MISRILLFLGAVLLVIGSLLNWATIDTALGEGTGVAGLDIDGKYTLGSGVVVALVALLNMIMIRALRPGRMGASLLALVAGGIVFAHFTDINQAIFGVPALNQLMTGATDVSALAASIAGVDLLGVQIGVGLYITGGGAVIAFIGGLLPGGGKPKEAEEQKTEASAV